MLLAGFELTVLVGEQQVQKLQPQGLSLNSTRNKNVGTKFLKNFSTLYQKISPYHYPGLSLWSPGYKPSRVHVECVVDDMVQG